MEAAFLPFISMGWMQENIPLNYTPLFKIRVSVIVMKRFSMIVMKSISGERGVCHTTEQQVAPGP